MQRWTTSARNRFESKARRMVRPSELPAGLQAVPFSRATAIANGVSPRRLRAGNLAAPFHGIRQSYPVSEGIAWKCRAYR